MITKETILKLHDLSIKKYGGSQGVRDEGLMESAIARPYQTFGGEDLYPSLYEKPPPLQKVLLLITLLMMAIKERGFLQCLLFWLKII